MAVKFSFPIVPNKCEKHEYEYEILSKISLKPSKTIFLIVCNIPLRMLRENRFC
jgi:hypothetical protein